MIICSPQITDNPLVSVLIFTYNQEDTIAQAIEGALMQECEFGFEIVIADDASKDNTKTICKNYQDKYPATINLLLQETNQGIVRNYFDGIRLCRGEFIAQCAGDDYWIDPLKLVKQVNYFKNHPGHGVVSTNGYRYYVKNNKLVEGIAPLKPVDDGKVFHLTHTGGVYALPLSLMFRSSLLQFLDIDQFIKRKFSCEDVPMQAIFAKHTLFGHLTDLTCVYRVYDKSMTNTTFDSPLYMYYHEGLVAIKRYLDELFPGEVGFTEQWANDYLVYRRFLIAVYNFDYPVAKSELRALVGKNAKHFRAKVLTSTRMGFYIFCIAKRFKN